MIVTPRVREEVRRHFNCPTLEGAELEDQGGDGTELTHWEKRIFQVNQPTLCLMITANFDFERQTLASKSNFDVKHQNLKTCLNLMSDGKI